MKILPFIFLFLAGNIIAQPASIDHAKTVYVHTDTTVNLTARQTTLSVDLSEGSLTVTISEPAAWNEGWTVHIVQYNTSVTRQVTLNTTAASGDEFKGSNTDVSFLTLTLGAFDTKIYVCAKTGWNTRQWLSVK